MLPDVLLKTLVETIASSKSAEADEAKKLLAKEFMDAGIVKSGETMHVGNVRFMFFGEMGEGRIIDALFLTNYPGDLPEVAIADKLRQSMKTDKDQPMTLPQGTVCVINGVPMMWDGDEWLRLNQSTIVKFPVEV